jgi:hypothetical protein
MPDFVAAGYPAVLGVSFDVTRSVHEPGDTALGK